MSDEDVPNEEVQVAAVVEEVDARPMNARRKKKALYRARLNDLFDEYKKILIIQVDNVSSSQMQKVRIALRGKAVMLLGKNTLMRSVVRKRGNEKLNELLPYIVQNMGMVFTNGNPKEIRTIIEENKVPAAARVNTIAPSVVMVPAGPTGMDPGQTAFFQALGIATKIERGAISIVSMVEFIKTGDKITSSHVVLLQKLKIMPFFYSIVVSNVYDDGSIFSPAVLDLTPADILGKFAFGLAQVAALGFEIAYPTAASVPFQMRYAFKQAVALSMECGYEFKEATDFIKGGTASAAPAAAASAAPVAVVEEEESSSSGGAMFGMLGGEEEEEYEEEEEEEEDE